MAADNSRTVTVAELAAHVGGVVAGDGQRPIRGCRSLNLAGPQDASFLSNIKYTQQLAVTNAGCVIVSHSLKPSDIDRGSLAPLTLIQTADPYFSFREIVVLLHGFRVHAPMSVSPLAAVAKSAKLGANCQIHPFACVGENAVVGDRCVVYPGAVIMARSRLGDDCIVYPNAVIYDDCVLGNRCVLQSGAVIGSDGYGFATHHGIHHKIPQIGNVILEDDVEIGANSVIERAAMESTTVAKGTKLGNAVVIGHNCQIGEHNLLVSQVGIAGSTQTGHHVVFAGQVGVAGHLTIGNLVRAAAQAGIAADVPDGQDVGGTPAMEMKQAKRVYLQLYQLPEIARKLRELQREIAAMKTPPSTDA